ncbi:MAG: hypothetical protein R2874_17525 [Desulfobacterales bacterium]
MENISGIGAHPLSVIPCPKPLPVRRWQNQEGDRFIPLFFRYLKNAFPAKNNASQTLHLESALYHGAFQFFNTLKPMDTSV